MNTERSAWARALAFCLALCLALMGPMTSALAQEEEDDTMDFTVDEVEGEQGGEQGGEEGGDSDTMDFTVDEAEAAAPSKSIMITGLILRSELNTDLSVTNRANEVLLAELDKFSAYGYANSSPQALKDQFSALGEQGTQDCLYNPVCLTRIGRELGLDKMVIGRLGGTSGDYSISLDLINIEQGTVEDYVSRTVKGGEEELGEAIVSSAQRLFNVRIAKKGGGAVAPQGPSDLQVAMAWTTLGVGVVSLGVGAFFGLDARSIETEVEDAAGAGSVTQVDAQGRIDDAKSSATLANVFYGVGIAAGVTSVLLFLITPGSDIATEEELAGDGVRIAPMLGPDGAGVSAGFSW